MAKEKRFVKVFSEGLGTNEIWVDTKTGVNYLYHSGGLTVLLNRDGTPAVTTVPKKEE